MSALPTRLSALTHFLFSCLLVCLYCIVFLIVLMYICSLCVIGVKVAESSQAVIHVKDTVLTDNALLVPQTSHSASKQCYFSNIYILLLLVCLYFYFSFSNFSKLNSLKSSFNFFKFKFSSNIYILFFQLYFSY